MRVLVGLSAAGLIALSASMAQAGTLFSDTFASEPAPGATGSLNYTTFNNFTVIDGYVDLLDTPNTYGITGTDIFVDLDGSGGEGGQIETKNSFNFNAGQLVTLSFDASGNQRNANADNLFGGFDFGAALPVFSFIGFSGFESANPIGSQLLGIDTNVPGLQKTYTLYSLSFRAQSAGSFTAVFGTGNGSSGSDNEGPILDNVSITAVPEPATWAMLIMGFAGVGAALRRRSGRLTRVTA